MTSTFYISHSGVKGMKWGVRRFQKKDGSLTPNGKKRYSRKKEKRQLTSEERNNRNKKITRGIIAGAAGAATIAGAALYVHKNPEKIGKVISAVKNVKISEVKDKTISSGKRYIKSALTNAKEGIKEGTKEAIREAPKKAAKAVVGGAIMVASKKALDYAVGREESAKIFQANDNKKIGKFWKVGPGDKDEKDDDE